MPTGTRSWSSTCRTSFDGATSTATTTPATDAAAHTTLTIVGRSPNSITDTGNATTGAKAEMINAVAIDDRLDGDEEHADVEAEQHTGQERPAGSRPGSASAW